MAEIFDWIDERTGYRGALHALVLLNFPVSRAARWRYVWGGALALMFIVEIVTGTLLMTVYSPSEASAWGSVQYLETGTQWGSFVRGVHHYTSHTMLVVIVLHGLSVIVTAGYRRPKEFTYWTGIFLAGLVLALAISGNPLPWDQKGYWAYQIETGIAGTMPGIGPALRTMLVGGSEFGNLTLTRLYTLHVMVLPVLAGILLYIHVALMRREKLQLMKSRPSTPGLQIVSPADNGHEPYWPFQAARNLIVFSLLMAAVVALVAWYPQFREKYLTPASSTWESDLPVREIALEAPADPDLPYVARPEWFVRFLFELRHRVDKKQEVLVTGALPVAILLLLLAMPFYEKILGRMAGHLLACVLALSGLGAVGWLTWTGYEHDRHDADYQESRRREIDYAGRALWLAHENGIPPEGPVTLLQNDAKAKGALLFAAHCAACHTWNGHDGTGRVSTEVVGGRRQPAVPTAADLSGFGTRDWIAAFLAKPADDRFFGHADRVSGGAKLKNGEMAKWAAKNLAPAGQINEQHLRAVAALLAREAARTDAPTADAAEIETGIAVFSGNLDSDKGEPIDFAHCLQCHNLKAGDPDGSGSGGIAPGPDLNGYGSKAWLRDFIRNPGDKRFYGKKNLMPAFDESRLSARELELLVDWMRLEWARAAKE
ncbi:MAG: cytochrome b N-terminal domain-containing protein [Deltaproteobacteria bacterium]